MQALEPRLAGVHAMVIFAGKKYREFLEPELDARGIQVLVPMKGLPIGKQQAWLNARIAD